MPKSLTPRGQAAPPVEPNVAQAKISKRSPKKTSTKKPKPTKSAQQYVRNLHNINVRVRLHNDREIELAPRGQREDIEAITPDDLEDHIFLANQGVLFEVIDAELAQEVISKQWTNAYVAKQPRLEDFLTNPTGQPYERENVHVGPSNEEQAIIVGRVESAPDGKNTSGNTTVTPVGPERVAVPGSVDNPIEHPSSQISAEELDEYREFLAWKKMRRAMAEAEDEVS